MSQNHSSTWLPAGRRTATSHKSRVTEFSQRSHCEGEACLTQQTIRTFRIKLLYNIVIRHQIQNRRHLCCPSIAHLEDPHIAVAIRLAIAGRCLPIPVDDDVFALCPQIVNRWADRAYKTRRQWLDCTLDQILATTINTCAGTASLDGPDYVMRQDVVEERLVARGSCGKCCGDHFPITLRLGLRRVGKDLRRSVDG